MNNVANWLIALLAVVITVVGFLAPDTSPLWWLIVPGSTAGAVLFLVPLLFPLFVPIVVAVNVAFWFTVLYTLHRVASSLRMLFRGPAPPGPRFPTREEYEAWKRSRDR
jgi:MFS superfamily sulfate permease-like transporter